MNMEKFTERSRGFLQSAQTIAIRENQQRVMPEHLLKALMDDDQGLAANLITRAGGDAKRVREAVDAAVAKQPKVSGSGSGQVYVDPSLVRVLDEAQKLAQKAGDSFVPAERILTALAIANTNARDALQKGGVTAQALNADIPKVIMGVAWGDAWTNLLQPFWALPMLGIAGLKPRDIMGFCVVALLFTGTIIGTVLLLA